MSKNKKPWNYKSKLVSAIRRLWLYSPMRRETIKRANEHCELCKEYSAKLTVDHISPTVPVTGWDGDWTGYITRMMVEPMQLRALCKNCHDTITKVQNHQRKTIRSKKKENK